MPRPLQSEPAGPRAPAPFLLAALALVLPACDGGGASGGGARRSTEPQVMPDGPHVGYWDEARTQKREEGAWQGGKETGRWTYWDQQGRVAAQGEYVDGERSGRWVFHVDINPARPGDPPPRVRIENDWQQGQIVGEEIGTYENGQVWRKVLYADGKPDGPTEEWHPGGERWRAGQYLAGKKTGTWQSWHASGQLASQGEMVDDQQDGTWRSWYPDGSPEKEGSFVAGKNDGVWRRWHPDGTLLDESHFRMGRLHGPYRAAYPGGQPQSVGTYAEGQRAGVWRFWRADGSVDAIQSGLYQDDVRVGDAPADPGGAPSGGG